MSALLRAVSRRELARLRRWSLAAAAAPAASTASWSPPPAAGAPPAEQPAAAWLARPYSKAVGKSKGKKGGGGAAAATVADEATGSGFNIGEARQLMARAVDRLQHELANIRTGRATPGMLDHLKVDLYGERLQLKACGTVSVRDAQLLAVTVFDPAAVHAVKKAVEESALQLSPRAEGQEVLVPIPRPTAETLAAMGKVCKQQAEAAKVTVRHARQQAMHGAKAAASEDERKRLEREVQKLTDEFVAEIDALVAAKERSIREHSS
eukprot:scaffold3.g6226.t1